MAIIPGTIHDDNLPGTLEDDIIDARGGDDIVNAGDGSDFVKGGAGNDTINGEGGDDTIDGGAGNDVIDGGDGDNILTGGVGADEIHASDGKNTIDGGAGADFIQVGDGDNSISGGARADEIHAGEGKNDIDGGAGDDIIEVGSGNNTILGGSGDDQITVGDGGNTIDGGAGKDTITAGDGDDEIHGGDAADTIAGGGGTDTIYGDGGNDNIKGGGGDDVIHGGAGRNDSAVYSGKISDYTVKFYSDEGGYFTVTDNRLGGEDGTDKVYHNVAGGPNSDRVEKLHFDGDNTDLVICFMAGTRIRTRDGEVPVEQLKRGDLVLTADGRTVPVTWLGRQTVSALFGDPLRVLPIRIKASALGENVPSRHLLISPDHAILIDGALMQAGALVNGTSIVRQTTVPKIFTYYHVELDDHSLILAENTPAETFIDNVDRLAFDNWAEHEALYPEGKRIVELPYPRAKSHRQVPVDIRVKLADRAQAIGAVPNAAVAC